MTIQDKFLAAARATLGSAGRNSSDLNRFRHIDGSPYGSTGIARAMLTPAFQFNALLVTLGNSMDSRHGMQSAAMWMTEMLCVAGVYGLNRSAISLRQRRKLIVDTDGVLTNRSAASEAVMRIALTQGANMAGGLTSLVCSAPLVAACLMTHSMGNIINKNRIRRGQWTVTTEPPPPRVPEPKAPKRKDIVWQPA